jgi:hypothetical protein
MGTYGRRVLFIIVAGIFASVSVALSDPIWFHQPWGYPVFGAVYQAGGWVLAAPLMAAIIKAKATPVAATE